MLVLRFFVCHQCETVFALPEVQSKCGSCGRGSLEEITSKMHGDTYFVPPADPNC